VISQSELVEMQDLEYRHGVVNAQIEVDLPLEIRALRKQRGWTQPELAERAEMKQPRISAMEKTGGANFTLETLKRLAKAFDVALIVKFAPFSELLRWSDRFNPDEFFVPGFEAELPDLEDKLAEQELSATSAHSSQQTYFERELDERILHQINTEGIRDGIPPYQLPTQPTGGVDLKEIKYFGPSVPNVGAERLSSGIPERRPINVATHLQEDPNSTRQRKRGRHSKANAFGFGRRRIANAR
jgi:transcriptional regulator with XRE-family HTH domain